MSNQTCQMCGKWRNKSKTPGAWRVYHAEDHDLRVCPHCASKRERPKKQNASRTQWFERKRAEREEYAHRWA